MEYRKLGKAGIKLSALSLGSWITFGSSIQREEAKQLIRLAFERGVNFFDTAEAYSHGQAEVIMGEAFSDFRREDLVISTKIFFGGAGPNDKGLSFKHLLEGTKNSLKRLNVEYVDLLFCHRPDPDTPMEEIVRAMDIIIRSGFAFYWGTSEWSFEEIEEAHHVAKALNAIPPSMEQPEYNLFHRKRLEQEYAPLYTKYGMGTTIWSPLAGGLLTGKYMKGIPKGSRFSNYPQFFRDMPPEQEESLQKLDIIVKELGITLSQLAIAWVLKNKRVSSVILGANNTGQLQENLKAEEASNLLTEEVMKKIEELFPL